MAYKPGAMSQWPWEGMGDFKYLLYTPFVAAVAFGFDDADNWAYHTLCIAALRYLQNWLWIVVSRTDAISGKHKIQDKPINYEQIDREDRWDDYIILHVRTHVPLRRGRARSRTWAPIPGPTCPARAIQTMRSPAPPPRRVTPRHPCPTGLRQHDGPPGGSGLQRLPLVERTRPLAYAAPARGSH
mmetsp:Transcript_29501/g.94496  ORF Transcript_29501/g.94496 Transcript_29501/m.94496 type:complete len:185 (+) Transcript_29501:1895-2449(+)